jgi:signal transduction histidine kinase
MSFIQIEKPRDHVTLVTLNRPERMNAMAFDVMIPLRDALRDVSTDNDCRVVVLTGAGHGFCSGADLVGTGMVPNIDGLQRTSIARRAMQVHARDRNLSLELDPSTPPRPIKAGTELVRRMAETMIEAGVRNANAASAIEIAVRESALVVTFKGSPLSEKERTDVFEERAFVGDSGRRLRLAPAFGLPFVKRAARALGGDLVADESTKGVQLRLTLP